MIFAGRVSQRTVFWMAAAQRVRIALIHLVFWSHQTLRAHTSVQSGHHLRLTSGQPSMMNPSRKCKLIKLYVIDFQHVLFVLSCVFCLLLGVRQDMGGWGGRFVNVNY